MVDKINEWYYNKSSNEHVKNEQRLCKGANMTTSRLTVRLPKSDIDILKKYARMNRISVSNLIDRWIKILKAKSKTAIHPDIEKFTGIIPADIDVDQAITEFIMEKNI
jgi:hypothetical protein